MPSPTRRLLRRVLLGTGLSVALVVPAATAHVPEPMPMLFAAPAPPTRAERLLEEMTLAQQVGQLFVVGTPADEVDRRTLRQIGDLHVGSVMLTGRSYRGVRAPARVTRAMRAQVSPAATAGVRLFVATDQEGGQVRVLQGRGFSEIPSALAQGRWSPRRLRTAAARWAGELRRAGVNLDLGPVLDTVPGPRAARHNPPIGLHDRQYGYTPQAVTAHGLAFARGLADGRVAAAVKHFPGLGRVRANTDTAANVVDRVTRRGDPYLAPFRAAVDVGVPMVMMSTARYTRLDPERPAAFSPYVIGTLLRGDLGFDGVVISDDLAHAEQVAGVPPAQRAVRFLSAGGDLVLSVDPAPVPAMYRAVLRRARIDAAFRDLVRASALRVLTVKQEQGLLPRG